MTSLDEIELEPCPHCGGKAEYSCGWDNFGTWAWVRCKDCNGGFALNDDEGRSAEDLLTECAEKWNRRTPNV